MCSPVSQNKCAALCPRRSCMCRATKSWRSHIRLIISPEIWYFSIFFNQIFFVLAPELNLEQLWLFQIYQIYGNFSQNFRGESKIKNEKNWVFSPKFFFAEINSVKTFPESYSPTECTDPNIMRRNFIFDAVCDFIFAFICEAVCEEVCDFIMSRFKK